MSGLQNFRGGHRGRSSPLTLQQPWWEGLCHGRACIQAPIVQGDPCVGWNAWPVPQKSLETSKSMEELITQLCWFPVWVRAALGGGEMCLFYKCFHHNNVLRPLRAHWRGSQQPRGGAAAAARPQFPSDRLGAPRAREPCLGPNSRAIPVLARPSSASTKRTNGSDALGVVPNK